jgi:hypothetical protein
MEEYQLSRILSFCQSTAKKRQNQHVVKPPWNPNWLPAAGIEHPNVFLVLPPETLENFPVITKPGGL